jgi:hypothetical protein
MTSACPPPAPRCVPWLQATTADVNALCTTNLSGRNLTAATATATTLVSEQTTVTAQLTAASLAAASLAATGLAATTLTATGDVAIADSVVVNGSGVGPQLFTVSSTAAFVIPATAASSCTVYFPATLAAGASCTLPTSPPDGLIVYVCNASSTNAVTVAAPTGALILQVAVPGGIPAATYTLALASQARFVWAVTQWLESTP